MIQYLEHDATRPIGEDRRIIAHVCNDIGAFGAGFSGEVARRWPEVERRYRAWARGGLGVPFELGMVQLVRVEEGIWVANMIGQRGVRSANNPKPIDYDALAVALAKVADRALELGASVHMPRIGTGLAGGSWDRIEPLIEENLVKKGVVVTVYDWPPRQPEKHAVTRRARM